jgi:hypothetical protein
MQGKKKEEEIKEREKNKASYTYLKQCDHKGQKDNDTRHSLDMYSSTLIPF